MLPVAVKQAIIVDIHPPGKSLLILALHFKVNQNPYLIALLLPNFNQFIYRMTP